MTWIRTYGRTALMCDGCNEAQISVDRDEVPSEQFAAYNDPLDYAVLQRARKAGWSDGPRGALCAECGKDDR